MKEQQIIVVTLCNKIEDFNFENKNSKYFSYKLSFFTTAPP